MNRDDDPHAALMRALLQEQFGTPTPEWHPKPADVRDAQALRLVADNDEQEGEAV